MEKIYVGGFKFFTLVAVPVGPSPGQASTTRATRYVLLIIVINNHDGYRAWSVHTNIPEGEERNSTQSR